MLHAYVDETGDRGSTAKSSRFFAMAGVVVPERCRQRLNDAVAEARRILGVPATKPLHWQEHAKVHPRRQVVTSLLAEVPDLVVNYVLFEKASIPAGAALLVDQSKFYNFVAGLMMERLLMTAQCWPGGAQPLAVRLGHVRGFDHASTSRYLQQKARRAPDWQNWGLLTGPPRFVSTDSALGMQAADQYAGMLHAALVADRYGGYEPQHLLRVRHQIRRRPGGSALNWGFKAMVQDTTLSSYPWWPGDI